MTASAPTVPRKFRMAFNDKQAARASVDRILAWKAENMVFAHGPPVIGDGNSAIARAFDWLRP